jgi:hypothetical protein
LFFLFLKVQAENDDGTLDLDATVTEKVAFVQWFKVFKHSKNVRGKYDAMLPNGTVFLLPQVRTARSGFASVRARFVTIPYAFQL